MKGIVAVVVIVLVLGGGAWFWKNRQATVPSGALETKEVLPQELAKEKDSSLVGSIKEAMGLGQQMRCTYTASAGDTGVTSTVFVDGQKFKSETEVSGVKTEALFDGETQYVWTSGSTQGFKFTKACMESLKNALPETKTAPQSVKPENYEAAFDTAKNVQCTAAGEADFSLPKEVVFTDQCAMMEQSKQMMEQAKKMMPQGSYSGR